MSWSKRFVSLELFVGFSIFDSVSLLLKFGFCATKSMDSLTLKHYNSSENWNNRKVRHTFGPRTPELWFDILCLARTKKFTKFSNRNLSVKREIDEVGADISRQIVLRNLKVICWRSLRRVNTLLTL